MPVVLTGIKPTGVLHLGNYLGAIRPALSHQEGAQRRFFIADVHALNQGAGGAALRSDTLDITAAWLACGLDRQALLYRQSDVPEILELAALLTPLAPKGLMNRAHAYKAKTAENRTEGRDPDDGVNMGLFTYPILMAADILAFDTDWVPVGADQLQHIEMTVDLAQAAHRRWGPGLFRIPQAQTHTATLVPGIDGQKMSKSHGNVVPLFAEPDQLRRLVRRVPTDSRGLGEPKDPGSNVLSPWFRAVSPSQADDFDARLRAGQLGWGAAKDEVAEALERLIGPLRERFLALRDEASLDALLAQGGAQARDLAARTVARVKAAVFGR